MKRTPLIHLLASLCFFVIPVKGANAPSAKPNIVFLLAGDLGGGELHCYGYPYSRTPINDSFGRDGTRFKKIADSETFTNVTVRAVPASEVHQ